MTAPTRRASPEPEWARRLDALWVEKFPDPEERAAWRAAFPKSLGDARKYRNHFTDPRAAAAWLALGLLDATTYAHLHTRGIDPDYDVILHHLETARRETPSGWEHIGNARTRAVLMLTHPHLTRADRDALTSARLTLTEIDHLLATDGYDRDSVALVGSLQ